ncbi:hypothetical protein [Streptomyces sp. ODS28]|uniref:hypothetical protein n=1 Tax=Streptomyces sp. ODS28 TaxID=3136688 RepID=UPI0031F02661
MRIRTVAATVLLAIGAALATATTASASDDPQNLTPREQAGLEAATTVVSSLLGGGGGGAPAGN